MTWVERLADFSVRASYRDLSREGSTQLKIRILDALGCAVGALGAETARRVRAHVEELGTQGRCTLFGGGSAAPDRAALLNGALVRYLDFNDSYLAKGETCHPSDNLAAVLAAAEYAGATGEDLLAALAVAYQVQCRLSDEAPVRARGFDHTTHGSYAATAGVCRALRLDRAATANAIAISASAYNALRATRTGKLSNWKGLAYPNAAACCVGAAFLARHGITGPLEVVEGEKGFMSAISGHFELDWSKEDLERVRDTAIKRHNAEIHSQTAVEAALDLRSRGRLLPAEIERVEVETFDVAYHIIGGGEEGDKTTVATKEQADHSLPYLVAVALLDGEVMPPQFAPERIVQPDVQGLLRRVRVRPRPDFSARFPAEMPTRVTVALRDGRTLGSEIASYPGFRTRPADWQGARRKFERLCEPYALGALVEMIEETAWRLDEIPVRELTRLLAQLPSPQQAAHAHS